MKAKLQSVNIRTCILAIVSVGILIAVLCFLFVKKKDTVPESDYGFIREMLKCDEETAEYYGKLMKAGDKVYNGEDVTMSLEYVLFQDMFLAKYTIRTDKTIYADEYYDRWSFQELKSEPGGEGITEDHGGCEYRLGAGSGELSASGDTSIRKTNKGLEIYEVEYFTGDYDNMTCTIGYAENETVIPLIMSSSTRISISYGDNDIIFTPHTLYGLGKKGFDKIEVVYDGGEKNVIPYDNFYTGNADGIEYWKNYFNDRQNTDGIEAVYVDGVQVDFTADTR